jgi:hypothetical protein
MTRKPLKNQSKAFWNKLTKILSLSSSTMPQPTKPTRLSKAFKIKESKFSPIPK